MIKKNLVFILGFILIVGVLNNSYAFQNERFVKAKIFKVKLPKGWRSFKDHNYESYTPNKKIEEQFYTYASLYKIEFKQKPKDILNYIENLSADLKKFKKDRIENVYSLESDFGKTYVYETQSIWKGKMRKSHQVIFKLRDDYYCFTYSSNKDSFMIYVKQAQYIFENLEIKKRYRKKGDFK